MTPLVGFVFVILASPPATNEGERLFENQVRPLLVEHCIPCHGATRQKGGLRLDSKAGVKAGGDSGPVVVPGKPAESLLVKAVHYTDANLQMPPKKQLTASQIAALEEWVRLGAPDPRDDGKPIAAPNAVKHWAFQPIQAPPVPTGKTAGWVKTPMDAFILAQLEKEGLRPSDPADRRTLLRRLCFDLTGLPPTPEQMDSFLKNKDPRAYEQMVEELLASPRYGERWARHWLDVARYADTKDGVLMFGDDRPRPFAYTYRDYVIRAFNEDRPFDQFVMEQLAADRMLPSIGSDRLAAMGFLTLGRMFDNNIHDIIDDRIDVVTRGFLGLTVACARCHDHKYDPVPMTDYYALYGVFANSEAPLVPPPLDPKATGPEEYEKKYAAARKAVEEMLDQQYEFLSETARLRTPDYLLHVVSTEPDPLETAIFFFSLNPEDLRPTIVARWRTYLARRVQPRDRVFGPWAVLLAQPASDLSASAEKIIELYASDASTNSRVRNVLSRFKPKTRMEVVRVYGDLLKQVYDASKKYAGPLTSDEAELLAIVADTDSPAYFPKSQTRKYMSRAETDQFGGKVQELDRLAVKEPSAPGRALCLYDSRDLREPQVFQRGNPAQLGDRVQRHNLTILGGKVFGPGSGRLDLARAIVDPSNPLTARVLVNRIWMHHFGEPLADRPSDFGVRTSRPIQAALLDHLAAEFMAQGWSIKKLHREILLSSTYQQGSADRPEAYQKDPENKLYWRFNRQRLDFEAMRDSMLLVAGRLDSTIGGRPADAAGDASNRRRTIYATVDRQSLPGLFRAFDFASPDQSAERRSFTTVPQQALFAMNSPFVVAQARALAARPEMASARDAVDRARILTRLVLQREATTDEIRLATEFVSAAATDTLQSHLTPWEQWAQVLLLTNEFLFLD